jgi:3-(3-hydroxy-phenyl)propionate hydroxylase
MKRHAGVAVWREIGASPIPDAVDDETTPVIIVGAGPVGLALALDLGRRGHRIVVLNRVDFVAGGSKAICFAKRSLEIFDRLGVGQGIVDQGVVWNVGKVFHGSSDEPIFQFDMLPVANQKRPGFINIQQYHVEDHLLAALAKLANVEIRWGHEVADITPHDEGVGISVVTADGRYTMTGDWLVACDGSRSTVRECMKLDFEGRVFEDNFLIADVKIKMNRPAERWFWFDPPFSPGQSALLHKQPDDVWRLDFQLGWNIDRKAAILPENVEPLVRAMLGPDVAFTREWYSIYTFQCRRMARFVHGRVIFAGDSAHLVSPFGARGCNGGLADADNLGWKLDHVLRGEASAQLLESYNTEAIITADENIAASSRSTDFMTPKTLASRALRDAALQLAQHQAFARPFVNSGRLSVAVPYPDSPLNTPDTECWPGGPPPGSAFVDAPIGTRWLSDRLGNRFHLVADGWQSPQPGDIEVIDIANLDGDATLIRDRYAMKPGTAYLIRPDQYVAARWRTPTQSKVTAAVAKASGR